MKPNRFYVVFISLLLASLSCNGLSGGSTPAPDNIFPENNTEQSSPTSISPAPIATLSAEFVWAFDGGEKPFYAPFYIAMVGQGNLYVTDSRGPETEPRIVKFNSDGQFITEWTPQVNGVGISDIGSVAVDGEGNIYTSGDNFVLKFDNEGGLLAHWGGSEGVEFYPTVLAVDNQNQVFVVDNLNTNILKFDGEGNLVDSWEGILSQDETPVNFGDIAVDGQGNIYVGVNGRNSRVIKFDNNGQILQEWTRNENLLCGSPDESNYIGFLAGMWIDLQGHLYIADNDNAQICVFDENGSYIGRWGEEGNQPGQLNRPSDIVGDNAGNVYVVEGYSGNLRVQKFRIK